VGSGLAQREKDTPCMWKRARNPSPSLKRQLQVQLTVDATTSRDVLSAAARRWLEDGFTSLSLFHRG
jgi:hypothetical protein